MNNSNYFEAMRGLWLEHGGEPDKELHPEDYGRYVAARMAEARRPDSRLSDFDAWARRERREQAKADDLHGVRGALERIATALERAHPKQLVDLTCGELFEGVTFSTEAQHEDVGGGETLHSFVRLGLDGVGFDVRSINDEPAYCYGDATAEWHFTSPAELHALASAFRTKYAYLIDMVADEWARRAGDTIPAAEEA